MLKWLLVFASMCFFDCIIKYHVCHFLLLSKHISLFLIGLLFFFFLIKAEAVGRCSADLVGPCGSCKDFVLHSAGNGRSTDMLHQEGCVIRLIFPCDRAENGPERAGNQRQPIHLREVQLLTMTRLGAV